MVHEIWLLTFVHILIGWCAKMRGGGNCYTDEGDDDGYYTLDEFTLVDDGMKRWYEGNWNFSMRLNQDSDI